mgnify:CR=1 FL=1
MILFHEKDCIVQIPFGKRALCTKMATDETADKDRRAYKVPIPGNKSVVVTYGYPLLLGVTQMADGYNFTCSFTGRGEESPFMSFFWMKNIVQDGFFLSL